MRAFTKIHKQDKTCNIDKLFRTTNKFKEPEISSSQQSYSTSSLQMIFQIITIAVFVLSVNADGETLGSSTDDETALEKLLTATLAKSADHFCAILALLCVCVGIISVSVYKFVRMSCCTDEDKHCQEMVNIMSK